MRKAHFEIDTAGRETFTRHASRRVAQHPQTPANDPWAQAIDATTRRRIAQGGAA